MCDLKSQEYQPKERSELITELGKVAHFKLIMLGMELAPSSYVEACPKVTVFGRVGGG